MSTCAAVHRTLGSTALILTLALLCACRPTVVSPTDGSPGGAPVLPTEGPPSEPQPVVAMESPAAPEQATPDTQGALQTPAPTQESALFTGASPQPTPPRASSEPALQNLVAAVNGGRVLSATDELPSYPASHLIDGYKLDEGEWWTHDPPTFPQVVVLALAGDRTQVVDRVVLNAWTSEWRYAWVKDFQVYASTTSPNLDDMGLIGSFTLEHVGIDQEFTFDPVRARYVALVVNSHYGSEEGISLNEFEVHAALPGSTATDPPPARRSAENLVAASNGGRIADYSSQDALGNWPVERLIDGKNDTDTGWSSDSVEGRQYVTFALAKDGAYRVGRVVLNPYSKRYMEDWIQEFELWASDTAPELEGMDKIDTFRLAQVAEDQEFTFDPIAMRYIALVPVSNYGGDEFALNEFEVYESQQTTSQGAAGSKKGVALPGNVQASAVRVERPPSSRPEASAVLSGLAPRLMAAGRDSVLDQIEYEIGYSDLVPVIYHLYGTYFDSLVTTTLTNRSDRLVKARVETGIPNYTETAVETVALAPGETVVVVQNPSLTANALDQLHSQKKADVHVRLDYVQEGEMRLLYEGTKPLTIYSREDFPWNIPGYYNGTLFLATMVMPNDPALDALMRAAADYVPGGIITMGYDDQEDGEHTVWDRMKAIYDVLAEVYDVIYVAVGTDFVPKEREEEGFTLQRLKLPYEVLESHSGMCVELSTLLASAFEKIGLRPILITVPGHVYVAVPISWDSNTYYVLEGTLVGRESFETAIQVGNEEFMEDALPYIEADLLDLYYWLDVSEARQEGIWPIPWR